MISAHDSLSHGENENGHFFQYEKYVQSMKMKRMQMDEDRRGSGQRER